MVVFCLSSGLVHLFLPGIFEKGTAIFSFGFTWVFRAETQMRDVNRILTF